MQLLKLGAFFYQVTLCCILRGDRSIHNLEDTV